MPTPLRLAASRFTGALLTVVVVAGGVVAVGAPASAAEVPTRDAVTASTVAPDVVPDDDGGPIDQTLDVETPTIVGIARVGESLSVSPGTWTEGTTFAYQWLVDGTAMPGATSSTFPLTAQALGASISVVVQGTKEGYSSANAASAPTSPVEVGVLAGSSPIVSGVVAVGSELAALPGSWTRGTELTYQWFADDLPIIGATAATLGLPPTEQGKKISVEVTGTQSAYEPMSMASAATVAVAAGSLGSAVPAVTGTLAVGCTLTAIPGAWTAGTALSFQWYANGAAIVGATMSEMQLGSAQLDKQITVRITGSLAGYATAVTNSAPTAKVAAAGAPTISGTARVGAPLTASPGAWTTSTAFTYQWYADQTVIPGATASTFVPTAAEDGKAITVVVIGTKAGYGTVAKSSSATLRVMRFSAPSVAGSLGVGYALTAKPNTWSAGTVFSYQWYAGGVAISGATKSTFTLTSAQRDKQISVKVTGRQAGFASVAAASSYTAKVSTVSTPTVSGVFMVGAALTAKPNAWTPSTTFTYQWFADGIAIAGATRSTLAPGSGQRDKQITVTVTGHKSGYGTIARSSVKSPKVALTAAPGISGTLLVGRTLSARTGAWTPGTAFSYQWFANGVAISGATRSTLLLTAGASGKRMSVHVVGSLSGYQTIRRDSAVTSTVAYPLSTTPIANTWNCPSWAPIKGNQSSMIYHMPGQRYYNATNPEACFRTEAAAVAAGYRKAKV